MSVIKRFRLKAKNDGYVSALATAFRFASVRYLPRPLTKPFRLYSAVRPIAKRECVNCGYVGYFDFHGSPPRIDAKCPKCLSLERHRLFALAWERGELFEGEPLEPVVHFAPERVLESALRKSVSDYRSADLFKHADLTLNMESIDLPDNSVGTVIANHVLEHVDDGKASREILRILKPGGRLIASVPIIEGWGETYENPNVATGADRLLHYGQADHVRYFGRDFRDRISKAGFSRTYEITAGGEDAARYALAAGQKIFVFVK